MAESCFFFKCSIAVLPEKIGKKTQIKIFTTVVSLYLGDMFQDTPHSKCLKLDSTEPIDTVFFLYIYMI